jgi:hypothetical protein
MSRGISPALGISADLASSSDVSYYDPNMMANSKYGRDTSKERHPSQPDNSRDAGPQSQSHYMPGFMKR